MEKEMTMQFNTREFTYHKGTFIAEASDFGGRFNSMFSQVFSDACDEGFELVSERTGAVVKITLKKVHFDDEGDLTHWEFVPYRCNKFNNLVVFND